MAVIDFKSKCQVEGCTNLGDMHSKKVRANGDIRVYRKNICAKHKKQKYKIMCWSNPSRMKESGKFNICERCGWKGPCDVHRTKPGSLGGKYSKANVSSLCPNCHRLFHRGLIEFKGYKVEETKEWSK